LAEKAETLTNLGSLYHQIGKHDEALDYLNQARKIEQTQGLLIAEGLTIQEIGDVHTSQGNYQGAIEDHKQSIILFQRSGNKALESIGITRIISLYKNYIGDNIKALNFINEALKIDNLTGDKERYGGTLNHSVP
jgi:tetratricopeptide (TPR) repeat protein